LTIEVTLDYYPDKVQGSCYLQTSKICKSNRLLSYFNNQTPTNQFDLCMEIN